MSEIFHFEKADEAQLGNKTSGRKTGRVTNLTVI